MLRPDLNYRELYVTFDSKELPVLIELIKASISGHDGIVPLAEFAGRNGGGNNGCGSLNLAVAEKFDTLPDGLRHKIGAAAEFMVRYQLKG